jgi:catechol 2,3-dioxygenase-like lactoylglutathione lyase family enzyme
MKPKSISPVFHVRDVDAAVRFYTEALGFTQSFRFGNYAGLKLGICEIHICTPGDYGVRRGGNAYIFCDEVDEYFRKIVSAGAKPTSEPRNHAYGMRDFVILDPDGNQLSFGCDIESETGQGSDPHK